MTSADEQKNTNPEKALQRLKDGHERFQKGESRPRVPPETLFDEGIGDLFIGRVAGNVINEDLLGSMEFACEMAGTPLIVVMGHSSCGAVKGACNEVEHGNLTPLLHKIRPSIDEVAAKTDKNAPEFPDLVSKENVHRTIDRIREESTGLADLEEKGSIAIVGAFYDVGSGTVEWL